MKMASLFKHCGIMISTITILITINIFADDLASPKFPELPKGSDQSSIVMQLAIVPDHVAFGKPADFYVKFINCGKTPTTLNLDCVACADFEQGIRFSVTEEENPPAERVLRGSLDLPQVYLAPGETAVVRMANQLVTPGKHKIKACHYEKRQKILSNTVEFVMENHPFNDQEIKTLIDDCEKIINTLESKTDKGQGLNLLRIRLTYYNPYTIPLIKKYMEQSASAETRILMSQILGNIASAESAKDRGFHRDTSSTQFMLDRLKAETDSRVRADIILNTEFFFDSFDENQKKILKEQILPLLESKDLYLRYWAGVNIIDLFPERIPLIKEHLNRPGSFGPYDLAIKQRIEQMEEFRKNRQKTNK